MQITYINKILFTHIMLQNLTKDTSCIPDRRTIPNRSRLTCEPYTTSWKLFNIFSCLWSWVGTSWSCSLVVRASCSAISPLCLKSPYANYPDLLRWCNCRMLIAYLTTTIGSWDVDKDLIRHNVLWWPTLLNDLRLRD